MLVSFRRPASREGVGHVTTGVGKVLRQIDNDKADAVLKELVAKINAHG
jgi:hypothetical protein